MVAFFTTAEVLDAITAGHTTVDALADHFGVPAASYNLRADLRQLTDDGSIVVTGTSADGSKMFAPTVDRAANHNR